MPDDQDLPYLEMLYKFVYGKNSHYDLAMTRIVEPQAKIERMSEEEATTDRHDMREIERGRKQTRGQAGGREGSQRINFDTTATSTEKPLASIALHPGKGSATNPKMGRIFI